MCTETLPAPTQPDETPHVQPCHTGKAATVCGRCRSLLEQAFWEIVDCTCISCGAPFGQPHAPNCPQKSFKGGAS